MKQNALFYLGVDVSKFTLDVAFIAVKEGVRQIAVWKQFSNDPTGLKELKTWMQHHHIPLDSSTTLLMENTGLYHRLLWNFAIIIGVKAIIENAARIKWSMGIARGKSDKVDSRRLALYALQHGDELKATPVLNATLQQLKDFMTLRTKLLSQLGGIRTHLKELQSFIDDKAIKAMEKGVKAAVEGLQKSIKSLEEQINILLSKEEKVKQLYEWIKSVPGIGHLTAIYIICATNAFESGACGKKLACYAGVAPFEHSSGVSIKGKVKVHHMANKELKRLLHLCALTAIKYYDEFKDYYLRKKAEGKHSMSVLNAVKNKLMLRVAAVVGKKALYVDKYKKAA